MTTKDSENHVSEIPIHITISELQVTNLCGTAHIIRKNLHHLNIPNMLAFTSRHRRVVAN